MGTYVMFFGYTQQGVMNIKDSPKRVEAAKATCQGIGAKVKEFYAVMGMDRYDTMFILEAADDETVAKAALAISRSGNVHTNSLRAFTEDEFKKMIAALP
jgi:uncharacterized protein with GYD domain